MNLLPFSRWPRKFGKIRNHSDAWRNKVKKGKPFAKLKWAKSQKYITVCKNVSINYDQGGSNGNEEGELFLSNYPSKFKPSLSKLLGSPSDEIEENAAFIILKNQAPSYSGIWNKECRKCDKW